MALRSQTLLSKLACLALAAVGLHGQTYSFEVRHRHWKGGALGTLRISDSELSYEEHGSKKVNKEHARRWTYDQIQQLTVGSSEVRVLTYDDAKWQGNRDRELVFDKLPTDLAVTVYPLLARTLDQRFIAAAVAVDSTPDWQMPAKLNLGLGGVVGSLQLHRDRLVFDTRTANQSRVWKIQEIQSVSSSGPFDLTITTLEKSGFLRGAGRQFHFQLQQALPQERYNMLWREINQANGLAFLEAAREGR